MGNAGGVKNQTGRSAEDLIIEVPPGTVVKTGGTEASKLADLVEEGQKAVVCPGGRGGRGNTRFANSHNAGTPTGGKRGTGMRKNSTLN